MREQRPALGVGCCERSRAARGVRLGLQFEDLLAAGTGGRRETRAHPRKDLERQDWRPREPLGEGCNPQK